MKNKISVVLKVMLVFVGMVCGAQSLGQTNYYISTTGSNSNNGTSAATPKLTLAHVFSTYNLGSGDIIYVAAGTYSEKNITVGTDDEGFSIIGVSAASSIFQGPSSDEFFLNFGDPNNDNITVKNITIQNYKKIVAAGTDAAGGIRLRGGASGLSIIDCVFDNCDGSNGGLGGALYIGGVNAETACVVTISGTVFKNSNCTSSSGGGVIYSALTADLDVTITNCQFFSNTTGGYGAAINLNSASGSTLTMTNCLLYDNTVGSSSHGTVYGGTNVTISMINSTVYGNTVSGGGTYAGGVYTSTSSSFKNCILYGNSYRDVVRSAGTVTVDYCNYGTESNCTVTNSLTSDPAIVGSGNYNLSASSPCINAGTSSGAPVNDISGATRVGNPDIGCYEYICAASYAGSYDVGPTGTWSTLTAAIAELKWCMTASVTLNLQSGYVSTSETFPITFTNLPTSSGSSPTITLTIQPKAGANGLSISSNSTTGTLLFNNADNVYISGSPGGGSSLDTTNNLLIANTSTSGYVVKYINDASYNKLEYCNIKGVNASVSNGTIWISTASSTGNDNLTINSCAIRSGSSFPYNAIYSLGTSSMGNDNISITNNRIYNFSQKAISDSTNSSAWTITGNSFFQTGTLTPTSNMRMISIENAGSSYDISNNYFGGQASSCGGAAFTFSGAYDMKMIYFGTSVTGSNTISGNTFKNISYTSTLSAGAFSFIKLGASAANFTIGSTSSHNVFGATTGTGNVSITPNVASHGIILIDNAATGTININYNDFGAITTVAGATARTTGLDYMIYSSGGVNTIQNNVLGNSTAANLVFGAQQTGFYGIYVSSNSNGHNVSNNTIQNISNTQALTSGSFFGINITSTGTGHTCSSNTVGNSGTSNNISISKFANVYGIYLSGAASGYTAISSNYVQQFNCSNTSLTTFYGIYAATATTTITTFSGNRILNITTATTTGNTFGINVQGAVTVSGCYVTNFTTANSLTGISVGSGNYVVSVTGSYVNTHTITNGIFYGIYSNSTSASSSAITSNEIGSSSSAVNIDINSDTTVFHAGIVLAGSGNYNCSSNTIQGLYINSSQAIASILYGIELNYSGSSGTPATYSISSNTIVNLHRENTGAQAAIVAGIHGNGGATNTSTIGKNKIYNLENKSTSTSAYIRGVQYDGNTNAPNLTTTNNLIVIDNGSNTNEIYLSGIDLTASNLSGGSYNIYHNTIWIKGTNAAGTSVNTACIRTAQNGASSSLVTIGNILKNTRTNTAGSVKHYGVVFSATTAGGTKTFKYNYYATNDATNFNLYYNNVANSFSTWKSNISGSFGELDGASVGSVTITSTTGEITAGVPYLGRSAGTGVTSDIDGNTRAASPLRGCYESSCSTYSGLYQVGPTHTGGFTNLTSAILALSSCGISGAVTLQLQTDYVSTSESFPLTFDQTLATTATNTITVVPKTGANGLSITTANTTGTVLFDGVNYIYFDGRPGATGGMSNSNNLKIVNTYNTSSAAYAIKFINDASNNRVDYCNVRSNNTSTSSGTIWFSTGSSNGNENNRVSYCEIYKETANPANAIFALGDATVNGSNTIDNNYIYDYFHVSSASNGILLSDYNTAWTISNNRFYQTASIQQSGAAIHTAINITNTSSAGISFSVTGNTIGYSSSSGTGSYTFSTNNTTNGSAFYPIYLKVGTTATTVTANTITAIAISALQNSSDPGVFSAISVAAGAVNIGGSAPNANTIGATSGTDKITFFNATTGSKWYGIFSNSSNDVNITYNNIGGINTHTSTGTAIGYYFYGIYTKGSGNTTVTDNNIGSNSTSNSILMGKSTSTVSQYLYGIYNSATGTASLNNNTISNLSIYSSGEVQGIVQNNSTVLRTIYVNGNTIQNLSTLTAGGNTSTSAIGIYVDNAYTSSIVYIRSNTLKNFTVSNGYFKGVEYSPGYNSTAYIRDNDIGVGSTDSIYITATTQTFSTASASNNQVHAAVLVSDASTSTIYLDSNNIKNIVYNSASSYDLFGVFFPSPTSAKLHANFNVFDKIGASNTGAYTSDIYGIYYDPNTDPGTVTFKKNIFKNLFNSNTGSTPSIYGVYSGIHSLNFINNYINITNTDGSNSYTNTVTIYGLNSNTGTSTPTKNFYHNSIHIGGSAASGSALSYSFYQTGNSSAAFTHKNNIYQNARTGSTGVQYCYYIGNTTPNVTMDHNYYTAPSSSSFAYIAGAVSSTNFKSSANDYGGELSYYTTSPISFNSDGSGALNSESDYLLVSRGDNLSAVTDCGEDITGSTTTRATSAGIKGCYEYSCGSATSGPLTWEIGTGGNYTTLTAAINKLKVCGFSGIITMELNSSYNSTSESFPLNIDNTIGISSSKNIIIRPKTGVTSRSISSNTANSVIYLNGANYVTIDGRPGGTGSASQLTISNSKSAGASNRAVLIENNATNNTLQYCTVTADNNSTTAATAGVVFIGNGSSGNNSNTINNNTITYATSSCSAGVVSNNTTGTNTPCTVTYNVLKDFSSYGVWSNTGSSAFTISYNDIYQTAGAYTTITTGTYLVYVSAGTNHDIKYNNLGGAGANCNSADYYTVNANGNIYGVYFGGTGAGTNYIRNNNIKYLKSTATGTNGVATAIFLNNPTSTTLYITSNTIAYINSSNTGTSSTHYSVGMQSTGTCSSLTLHVNKNSITNLENGVSSSSALYYLGIDFSSGSSITNGNYYNNYINIGSGTARSWGLQTGGSNSILNNTIRVTSTNDAYQTFCLSVNGTLNQTIKNNLLICNVTSNTQNYCIEASSSGGTLTHTNNFYQVATTTLSAKVNNVATNWTTETGGKTGSVTLNADGSVSSPSYSNVWNSGADLSSSSPAINEDISGTTRNSFKHSIGCWEYTCGTNYSGTYEVGPSLGATWATLTLALPDLKTCMNGSVTLELQSAYTDGSESYPLDFAGLSTSLSATLTVRPKSNVSSVLTLDGSSTTSMLSFDGTDYVTIDGRPGGSGTNKYLKVQNTSTLTGGSAITFQNDATNNTIKYCNLISTYSGNATGVVTISSGSNSSNTIDNCDIDGNAGSTAAPTAAARLGIYSSGTGNNSMTITNNNIYNCFNTTVVSPHAGIYAGTGSSAWNITGNSIYQTATRTVTGNTDYYGIVIANTSSVGNTISNNYIGGTEDSCGGSKFTIAGNFSNNLQAIYINAGTASATSVQGNTIANISLTSSNAGNYFYGINLVAGNVNVGTTSGNTIGSSTANASTAAGASIALIPTSASNNHALGIYSLATTIAISNNKVAGINVSNSTNTSPATFWSIYGAYNTTQVSPTITYNTVGSTTQANSIVLGTGATSGIYTFYGISQAYTGTPTVQYNTIQNCQVYGSGASLIYGIYNTAGAATVNISNNTVSDLGNLSSGTTGVSYGIYNSSVALATISNNTIKTFTISNGYFLGIHDNAAATGTHTISNNTIGSSSSNNIAVSSTSTTANRGIYVQSTGTYNINNNTIRNITTSGAAATLIYGIEAGSTGTYNMKSNIIDSLKNSNNGAYTGGIYGIYFTAANASSTVQKNRITNFSIAQTGSVPKLYGICNGSTGTTLIYNNLFICDNNGTTNDVQICGISDGIGFAPVDAISTIYYNSIVIGGTASGSNGNTSCFAHGGSTASKVVACKNNIFKNSRSGGTGKHYAYYLGGNTASSATDNNYYAAASKTNFAYIGAIKPSTSATVASPGTTSFNSSTQGYGGANSKYYPSDDATAGNSSAITVNSDGSLSTSDLTTVSTGADLDATTNCDVDINDVTRNASGGYKGCYEGVASYYTNTAAANTDAASTSNWNSKTDGSGSAPLAFTTAANYYVQNGHQYKILSSWTGNASSTLTVQNGGALDVNAQTINTWPGITLNGTGVTSSGAIFNGSSSPASVALPLTLASNSTVKSSGTGGLTLTGNINTAGNTLTIDGSYATTISTGVISGSGGITKEGSGTLTLSGSNTYTGVTTINAGTLSVSTIGDGGSIGNMGQATNAVGNIVLGGGTIQYTGATATTNRAFSLTAATNSTIDVTSNTLTISGASGNGTNGALTKSGNGTLILSGDNTYSGLTTISAGALKLGSAGDGTNTPLGTTGAGTVVNSGATLDLSGYSLGTAEALSVAGTGVSSSGALMNSGSACTYSGLVTLTGDATINGGSGSITLSNAGTITGSGYNLTLGGAQGGTLSSILGTGAGTLTKQDAGTWTLSGANTYTGLTSITAGTLKLNNSSALGTTASGTSITSGAVLDLNGTTYSNAEALTVNGSGISSNGSVINSSATPATFAGLLTLGSASSIVGGTGTIAISNVGTITGSGFALTLGGAQGGSISSIIGTNAGTITKQDAGTWTLSGTNTYTGLTTVSAGTLKLDNTAALGTTANGTSITSGAVLDLNGVNYTSAEALTLNGTGVSSNGALINSSSTGATFGGLITLGSSSSIVGGSGTINVSNTGNISGSGYDLTLGGTQGGTLAGVLATGSGNLVKNGAGTWNINATNTYTGTTTISAGTAILGATQALSNDVIISSGATLNAAGNNIALSGDWTNNGTYTAGANTVTLTGSSKNINGTSNSNFYNLTISGSTSTGVDVTVNNLLHLNGATLTLGAYKLTIAGISPTLASSGKVNATNTSCYVEFTNTSAITLPANLFQSDEVGNLTMNGSGGVALGSNLSIPSSGVLTLTNGLLTLGSNNLYLKNTGSGVISGTPSASNMIVASGTGYLKRDFASGNSDAFTFPIGDNSGTTEYSPASLDFSANNTGGYIGVRLSNATPPDNGTASDYLNRYWEFIAQPTTYTYVVTLNYKQADVNGTEANMVLYKYESSAWSQIAGSTINTSSDLLYSPSGGSELTNVTGSLSGTIYTGRFSFPEPNAHPSIFTATATSANSIRLNFSAASTINNASGYIILRREDASFPDATNITDAVAPGSLTMPSGTTLVTTLSSTSTTLYLNTGLTESTLYRYAIIPFYYDGSNSISYNYRTSATIKTASATTNAASVNMRYSSSTVTQSNTLLVSKNSSNNQILGLQVVTTGPDNPIIVTSINFNTTGSTSASSDLGDAKIFYTGTSSTFSAANQFGIAQSSPSGSYTISGSQALQEGTNYFWLAYSISSGATIEDLVDGEFTALTVADTSRTPSNTAPTGSRKIANNWAGGTPGLETDWHTSSNWSDGVPSCSVDALLPSGLSYYPIISANANARKVQVGEGATLTFSGSQSLSICGDLHNDGTITTSTGTIAMVATGNNQAIDGDVTTTFNNLTINNSLNNGIVTLGADAVINGSLSLTDGELHISDNTLTVGSISVSSGTLTGDKTTSEVVINGTTSLPAISDGLRKLTVNTGNTLTLTGSITINDTLSVNGDLNAGTNYLTMDGLCIPDAASIISGSGINGSGTLRVTRIASTADYSSQYTGSNTLSGLTVEYAGTVAQTLSASSYGSLKVNNSSGITAAGNASVSGLLTLSSGTLTTGANTLTLSGSSAPVRTSGNIDASASGATVAFTNSGALTLPGSLFSSNTLKNLTINGAGGVTLGGNTTVSGVLALTNGILTVGGNTLTLSGTAPTRSSGNIDASHASATINFTNGSIILLPSSLFSGNINNLTINGAGVSLGSSINIAGNLTLTSGSISILANTLTLSGNNAPTRTSGTIFASHGSSVVQFTNTSAIILPASLFSSNSVRSLTMNGSGGVTLGGNLTIPGTLTLTNGNLIVGANKLTLSGASPGRTSGYVDASHASATVEFTNTSAMTLPSSMFTGNINNLTVNGAGGITLGSNQTIAGTLTLTTGALSIGSNTLTVNAISRTSGTLTGSSTSNLTTTASLTIPPITNGLNNLTINSATTATLEAALTCVGTITANGNIDTGNNTLTVNGTCAPAATSIISGDGVSGNGTIQVTRTSVTADYSSQYTGSNTLTNLTVEYIGAGAQTISAVSYGKLKLNNSSGASLAGSTSVSGLLTLTNGSLTLGANTLTLSSNTAPTRVSGNIDASNASAELVFTNTTGFTLPSSIFSGNSLNNLTLNGIGGITLGGNTTVSGSLTLSSGTLSVGSNTLTLSGSSPIRTTGNIDVSSGTLAFTNSGAITLPASLFSGDVNHLTLNGSGGVTLGSNTTVAGDITLTSGDLTVGANTLTISGSTVSRTSGTINASNASATLAFTNTGALSLPSGVFTGNVNNLTINGAGGVSLASNTTVANTLTLTSGKITLTNHTLTLGTSSANATVSGGGSSSYIVAYDNNSGLVGKVKNMINSNDNYNFPIGDATNYTPFSFTLNSNTALSTASLEVNTKASKIPGLSGDYLHYISRYWDYVPSGITDANYNMTMVYDQSDVTGTEANLSPIKSSADGLTWYQPTNSSLSETNSEGIGGLNTTTNTLTWTGLTTFSFGGGAGGGAPLPISLLSFEATPLKDKVKLEWTTATETNNDYFTIERSADAENFEEVLREKGAGNSSQILSYTAIDNTPLIGTSYYRLKQTDYDGRFTYSDLVAVKLSYVKSISKLVVYPNPTTSSRFNIKLDATQDETAEVIIYNSLGEIVKQVKVEVVKGANTFNIDLEKNAVGLYYIEFRNKDGVLKSSIVKM